ncbi:MAG: hypothetical protein HQL15_02235 [Candidatus Omnitrophica bacterium]|nr:hypothetical protein [Candidatus Omnitrophota bacterium]
MTVSRKLLILVCLLMLCTTQSGCALLQLPFQALGTAVGLAGQAAQVGIAAAPYAAPFFL